MDVFNNIVWQFWKLDSPASPEFIIVIAAVAVCLASFLE